MVPAVERRRYVVVGTAAGAVVALAAWAAWTARPGDREIPDDVDAIVVFAGQRSRVTEGVRLAERGVARTLVLSKGGTRLASVDALCAEPPEGYSVICGDPEPANTAGEAAMFAHLAEEHGWRSVLGVTSAFHVRRSQMLLERCLAGREAVVVAAPGGTVTPFQVGREMVAYVKDVALSGC
jgi:uncharacterized SAM-binding protein YcdF (DUF218 family)